MKRSMFTRVFVTLIAWVMICPQARADDYYYLPLKDLTLTAGSWPTTDGEHQPHRHWSMNPFMPLYVAGLAGEEMDLTGLSDPIGWMQSFPSNFPTLYIAIRT